MVDVDELVAVFRRALAPDLKVAAAAEVRAVLADLARTQSAIDARRIDARRRLDDLAKAGAAVNADLELTGAGKSSARDAAKVGERRRVRMVRTNVIG